jgi:SAM-dependent methyltransferase
MATPWDRAADRYLDEWVPRFVPYHLDLVRELAIGEGQKVLVASAGPGAEVLAVARAVGDRGTVRATDPSEEMVRICGAQVEKAQFRCVTCERAGVMDVGPGGWDAIVCAFGLWAERRASDAGDPSSSREPGERAGTKPVLERWASALSPTGKIGVLAFGPPEESDPFELLTRALCELEPDTTARPPRIDASREALLAMFEEAGLSIVRHAVLRHTVSFPTAEAFTDAIREGRTWRRVWEELGPERVGRVTARFYDRVGGPTAPLVFEPAVTLAIAAVPGSEVELANRPHSIRVPPLSSAPPKT